MLYNLQLGKFSDKMLSRLYERYPKYHPLESIRSKRFWDFPQLETPANALKVLRKRTNRLAALQDNNDEPIQYNRSKKGKEFYKL